MAQTGELIPADLYVQPPKKLRLALKSEFARFVRQFPPEHFIETDVPFILQYLVLRERLARLRVSLASEQNWVTENRLGTETQHPYTRLEESWTAMLMKLCAFLRVAPDIRNDALPRQVAGRSMVGVTGASGPLRIVYRESSYDPDEMAEDADVGCV